MDKQRRPLSTKNPPVPTTDHNVIEDWMNNQIMPGIKPMIQKIDILIHDSISNPHYAIKWGKAYYGKTELGWLIEVAAYHVSVNIVFLNGASFNPQPPLGSGTDTRYIKLNSIDELESPLITDFIKQAGSLNGWI